jgi:hypothetical protein
MRDHNETYEAPEHREHPNNPRALSDADSAPFIVAPTFSPWGGDNHEECEEEPCGGCFFLSSGQGH